MIHLVNYANIEFEFSQTLNSRSGKKVGRFDRVLSYTPRHIGRDFSQRNQTILRQKRGNGYWLWKPYIIQKSLAKINDGEYLFYSDAGALFIRPITPLLDLCRASGQDLLPFELPFLERAWTKRDAFILMGLDTAEYTETRQRLASYSLWRKSSFTVEFVREWLRYAEDERILTDLPNQCEQPNYPGFVDHRHDQSIFSLLTKRHRLEAFRDPSQHGSGGRETYKNSPYEQLIEHTRKREVHPWRKFARRIRASLLQKLGAR
jgi:hypothetical protein